MHKFVGVLDNPDLIDFYSNARQFYSSKGDPLGVKGLKNYLPWPFQAQEWLNRFLLKRQTILLIKGTPLGSERVRPLLPKIFPLILTLCIILILLAG